MEKMDNETVELEQLTKILWKTTAISWRSNADSIDLSVREHDADYRTHTVDKNVFFKACPAVVKMKNGPTTWMVTGKYETWEDLPNENKLSSAHNGDTVAITSLQNIYLNDFTSSTLTCVVDAFSLIETKNNTTHMSEYMRIRVTLDKVFVQETFPGLFESVLIGKELGLDRPEILALWEKSKERLVLVQNDLPGVII